MDREVRERDHLWNTREEDPHPNRRTTERPTCVPDCHMECLPRWLRRCSTVQTSDDTSSHSTIGIRRSCHLIRWKDPQDLAQRNLPTAHHRLQGEHRKHQDIPWEDSPGSRTSCGPNVAWTHSLQELPSRRTRRNYHQENRHCHRIREQYRKTRQVRQDPCPQPWWPLSNKNRKIGTLSPWWWSLTPWTQFDGRGSSSRSPTKNPLTLTSKDSSSSPARTHSALPMSKKPGTRSHGPSPCRCATTWPSNRLPRRFSKTQSPSPTSFHNLLARSPRAGKARTRRARARARPRTSTLRGTPIPDTSHTHPNHPTQRPSHSTLPLWPTTPPSNLCQPTSQRTSQGRQEQRRTQVQDLFQVPEIGTAQRLGDSIPASWPTKSPNHAAKPFTKTTDHTPRIFPWHRCLTAGLAVPQRQHHQDLFLGDWPLLQWTPWSSIPSTNRTYGRCYSDKLHHILQTTFRYLRQFPCYPHYFSTSMQRPLTSTGCTTRGLRQRWIFDPTDDKHRPYHSTTFTNIHHSIPDGECTTSSRHTRTIPWHLHSMGYWPNCCRCSRRTSHLKTPTLVARRRLEVREPPTHRIDTIYTIHWTLQDGHHKLHNPIASMIQPSVHVKDWETPAVLCNKHLFHCLTTQAPTDLGRPPPAHAQADDATWERWQQDNRQFPPWQYQPQFLTRPHEGEWQPITPWRDSWHCQMTTPRSQTNIHPPEPETPCWVTPGIFHQHFGYSHYYWWFLPAQHSVTHPHNPTYRNSRDCGLPPKRLGDHQPKPHTTNICHNSIGTVTLGGPALYKTPQQIIAILIPAYVGLSTNLGAYPTYNRFDRQSQQNSDFWSRNSRRPQLRGSNRYTTSLPTGLPTDRHDYTNTNIDTHPGQHPISTHSTTPTGTQPRIHPIGTFTPRLELACPHRLQIHISHLHRDTTTT